MPDISAGAIAGIVIGGVVFLLLIAWIYELARLGSYLKLDEDARPPNLFKAEQNDCCTLFGLNVNLWILKNWCGFTNTDDVHAFRAKDEQRLNLIQTQGAPFVAAPRYAAFDGLSDY
jgi:hypothetical protein